MTYPTNHRKMSYHRCRAPVKTEPRKGAPPMRTALAAITCILLGAGVGFAEDDAPGQPQASAPEASAARCQESCVCMMEYTQPCPRWWFGAEYLMWWVKDQSVPLPMATTGPAGAGAGALGLPGT